MRHPIILIALMVVLGACAARPTAEEIANADYGPRPDNAAQLAEDWVKDQLVDPYSARFEHKGLRHGYTVIYGNKNFGWVQCGTVNAKNRMGGYVGRRAYVATIRYGRVVDGHVDGINSALAAKVCNEVRSGA